MDHITSGMVLKESTLYIPTSVGYMRGVLWMEVRTMRAGKALLAFDGVQPAGKTTHRQLRRDQTVVGCLAGVQGFAHRPEHGFQSGCLSAGDTQGGDKLLLIKS